MKNNQLLQVVANAPADADVIVMIDGRPVVIIGAEFDASRVTLTTAPQSSTEFTVTGQASDAKTVTTDSASTVKVTAPAVTPEPTTAAPATATGTTLE